MVQYLYVVAVVRAKLICLLRVYLLNVCDDQIQNVFILVKLWNYLKGSLTQQQMKLLRSVTFRTKKGNDSIGGEWTMVQKYLSVVCLTQKTLTRFVVTKL